MNIEIDDEIADMITIKNLEQDLDILKRSIETITDPKDPDFIFSTEMMRHIENVLAYYNKPV